MNLVRNHSHWGAFFGRGRGRPDRRRAAVRARPRSVASDQRHPGGGAFKSRIAQPMVREGWLKHGPGPAKAAAASRSFRCRGTRRSIWSRARSSACAASTATPPSWAARRAGRRPASSTRRGCSFIGSSRPSRRLRRSGDELQLRRGARVPAAHRRQPAVGGRPAHLVVVDRAALQADGAVRRRQSEEHAGEQGRLRVAFHRGWIAELASAGVEVINISPIREDGPDAVRPEWIPIRPNTDTAMLLALTHTLVSEGLHDREFLEKFCVGFERVLPYLMGESDGQPKNAEWAAAITGVPADTIRALARRMAATRTMVTASWVLQRAHHGEQPYWAVVLLASALGQIGLPGGGFGFGYGSGAGIGDPPLSFAAPAMDGIKNPINVTIPAARISDCLLHPGEPYDFNGKRGNYPDIRLVYWAGGNPFHHHQDTNKLRRAWQRPETVVVHEPWWTATARHADIVLPATTSLERNDIGGARRDKFIIAMQQAVEPVGRGAQRLRHLQRAGAAARHCRGLHAGPRREWRGSAISTSSCRQSAGANAAALPDFDTFWEQRLSGNSRRQPRNTSSSATSAPIPTSTSCARRPARSSSTPRRSRASATTTARRIRPGSSRGNGSAGRTRRPIRCISFRASRATGCTARWIAARSAPAARSRAARRSCINPADAKARGISDGDVVRVHNSRGACLAGAIVSDTVSAGVVQLVLRRLVRSGRRRRAGALPARQCERADARPGHLEARAGAELGHRAGRGRALHGAAHAGRGVRSAAGRCRS